MHIHVNKLKTRFDQLEENQFTGLIIQMFSHIQHTLSNLSPSKRYKRWDKIGTVWKFIAGNPDANDLKIINSSINDLIINNNKQIKINKGLNLQIKELVFRTKDAIEVSNSKYSELYSVNIFLNLKYLAEKLEQIAESISLAKVGIVNEKILSQSEIDTLCQDISAQNITTHNILEALNYADTAIASNRDELTLLIKTPVLDPRIFVKTHIFPITSNKKKIYLRRRNYLMHESEYYMVESLVPTIYKISDLETDNTACIPKLLSEQQAYCNYTQDSLEKEVTIIDSENIILNTKRNVSMTSSCGMKNRTLNGTYLINFHDCEININNISFRSEKRKLSTDPIQLPLDGITIQEQYTIVNLSLESLHNMHLETRKELDLIRLENNSVQFPHWHIFGGMVSLPIIIGIILFFSKCYKKQTTIKIAHEKPSISNSDTHKKPQVSTHKRITLADIVLPEAQL